jgi:cytidylate kinase
MTIITISRQYGSGGDEIASRVAEFLDRLFAPPQPVARLRVWKEDTQGTRTVEELKLTEESLVALVEKAVRSAHHAGNLVIAGRGGQVILKDAPDVIHIRIEAPLEERVQRVKQQLKQTRSDFHADIDIRRAAQDMIEQKDAASRDYLIQFYHVAWNDPLLYHLVLNTGKMRIEQAVHAIVNLVHTMEAEVEVV